MGVAITELTVAQAARGRPVVSQARPATTVALVVAVEAGTLQPNDREALAALVVAVPVVAAESMVGLAAPVRQATRMVAAVAVAAGRLPTTPVAVPVVAVHSTPGWASSLIK